MAGGTTDDQKWNIQFENISEKNALLISYGIMDMIYSQKQRQVRISLPVWV